MRLEPAVPPPPSPPVEDREPEGENGLPRPNLDKLNQAIQQPLQSMAVTGLFVLASFYTLYFCRSLLLPLVMAGLFSLLLSPLVRTLKRLKIPEPVSAGLVILALLAALGFGIYGLSGPASDWIQRAPQSMRSLQVKLHDLQRSVQRLGRATEQMEKIADVSGTVEPRPPAVVQATPSLRERLFDRATDLVTDGVVMVILLYFLLASGDLFLRKLIRMLPRLADKRRAVEIARQVERDISAYLSTVTLINLGLGAGVALGFTLLRVPNPLLWGAMVALFNYVPYLGPALDYAIFTMVGVLTFATVPRMLAPVGLFLVLNVLEAYLFTPMILGRRLTLNPVVLFVGLTFWGWNVGDRGSHPGRPHHGRHQDLLRPHRAAGAARRVPGLVGGRARQR